MSRPALFLALLIFSLFGVYPLKAFAGEASPSEQALLQILQSGDLAPIKRFGAAAIDPLLKLYESGDSTQKKDVASALYVLSLKSEKGRELLMKDIHTRDSGLRLQVQWALGRLSSDESVVQALLYNMRNDPNPLFRDKAACALAHDQVHLTEAQRLLLLSGLVDALEDEKDDVRRIALLALQIQTGQTKGFEPMASPSERQAMVQPWKWWIAEYKTSLRQP